MKAINNSILKASLCCFKTTKNKVNRNNLIILFALLFIVNNCIAQENHTKSKSVKVYEPTPEAIRMMDSITIAALTKNQIVEVAISPKEADTLFLQLINQYRKSKGLAEVSLNACLDSASYLHSLWTSNNKMMTHFETSKNIDGKAYYSCQDRVAKYNKQKKTFNNLHENCGMLGEVGNSPFFISTTITKETICNIFDAWKESPGHNEAMLHPHITLIGFSVLESNTGSKLKHLVYSTLVMASL